MKQYIIKGGNKLTGEISVSGAKNSALKILGATILTKGENIIENVPKINDIEKLLEIIGDLGAQVERSQNTIKISTDNINKKEIDKDLGRSLRASIILAGPMLSRFKEISIPHPGGCSIGKRPVDMFIDGFKSFGASFTENEDYYTFKAEKIKGTTILFPKITVTGTETMMMTAVLAKGTTILKNAAQEPEIPALADYLNSCGAKIKGAGTSIITIEGVETLKANNTKIMPDRIETGTFVVMGLLTGSEIKITNCNPKDLENFLLMVKKSGGQIEIGESHIKTLPTEKFLPVDITTHEYPGFPTDLQAPFTLLLTRATGLSLVHEPIFDGRLFFTDKLNQMGANIIMCDPHRVIINGPTSLYGKRVDSPDLRAGATLLLAGLIAEGKTIIQNVYQIERGYENIVERLKKLGAKIEEG